VRVAAFYSISQIAPDKDLKAPVTEALKKGLQDDDSSIRCWAAESAAQWRIAEVLPMLGGMLNDESMVAASREVTGKERPTWAFGKVTKVPLQAVAAYAIQEITGRDIGFRPGQDVEEMEALAERARQAARQGPVQRPRHQGDTPAESEKSGSRSAKELGDAILKHMIDHYGKGVESLIKELVSLPVEKIGDAMAALCASPKISMVVGEVLTHLELAGSIVGREFGDMDTPLEYERPWWLNDTLEIILERGDKVAGCYVLPDIAAYHSAPRPLLRLAARSEHALVRRMAVHLLGTANRQTPKSRKLVVAALEDADPGVRAHAVLVVHGWGENEGNAHLLPLLADDGVCVSLPARDIPWIGAPPKYSAPSTPYRIEIGKLVELVREDWARESRE
jgi:hypothetical protein